MSKQPVDNLTVVNGCVIPLDDVAMGEAQALRDILGTTSGPIVAKALDLLSDDPGLHDYYLFKGVAYRVNASMERTTDAE